MRAIPAYGAICLAFGLLIFLSTYRSMREHVFTDARGDSYSIEIPRDWSHETGHHPFMQYLVGPIPSGGRGVILLASIWSWAKVKEDPSAPDEVRETWEAEGARYMFFRSAKTGTRWCRLNMGILEFSALVVGDGPLPPEDAAFYDHCLRSIRRIRK